MLVLGADNESNNHAGGLPDSGENFRLYRFEVIDLGIKNFNLSRNYISLDGSPQMILKYSKGGKNEMSVLTALPSKVSPVPADRYAKIGQTYGDFRVIAEDLNVY